MQAVARALLLLGGCSGKHELRRFGGQRFCSSQPWLGPPFLARYGETDPNAPGVVASPWSSGYPPPGSSNVAGMNRPLVPPPATHGQHFPPPSPALGVPRLGTQQPPATVRALETSPSSEGASEVFAGLIESFQRKGMFQEVDSLFRGMRDNHIVLSLPTYRTLMDCFAQQGDLERMDMVYLEMRKATMQSAGYPQPELTEQKKIDVAEFFANMADSCYKKGLLEEVQQIHRAMKAAQLSISLRMYNVLINTYSQLRDCRSMDAVYVEMREALAQRRVTPSATTPPSFPGAVPPPPVFATGNPSLGQYGEHFPAGNRAAWPGSHGNLQQSSALPPGSQFQVPSSYQHTPSPGSQFQPPGNSHFQGPRHLPPPPNQPFRPPTPGQHPAPGHQHFQPPAPGHQHFQAPAPGHHHFQAPPPGYQHFQPPAPGTTFQYPGHPAAAVPGYPPGVHPGSHFQFQPAQVAVPLGAQQFQPPANAQQVHVQPSASVQQESPVEEPSAAVEEEAEEEAEEEVSAETEQASVEAVEEPEAEAADGDVAAETASAEGAEEESPENPEVEYQESVGDSADGAEALESMVTSGEQPQQQQQLMESTG